MCGRSASSRNQDKIRHACAYRPRGKTKAVKPSWIDSSNQKYYPCYNVSPQMNTPVILSSTHAHVKELSKSHLASSEPSSDQASLDLGERVLQPMKWGLVPSWQKSKQAKSPPLLNNCRLEGILEKPSFRNAVEKRRRCVVVADGFFEWDRRGSTKRPYFIHFRDNKPTVEMGEVEALEEEEGGEGNKPRKETSKIDSDVINGRMLTMAGLFDVCAMDRPEGEPLYSYTVITVDAHADFAHIHDRMPAVLDGDEAVRAWLDPDSPTHEAIELLHPSPSLTWYPVSVVVNNVRNKTPECIIKIDPREQVSSKQKTLHMWFSKPQGSSASKEALSRKQEQGREGSCDRDEDNGACAAKKAKIE